MAITYTPNKQLYADFLVSLQGTEPELSTLKSMVFDWQNIDNKNPRDYTDNDAAYITIRDFIITASSPNATLESHPYSLKVTTGNVEKDKERAKLLNEFCINSGFKNIAFLINTASAFTSHTPTQLILSQPDQDFYTDIIEMIESNNGPSEVFEIPVLDKSVNIGFEVDRLFPEVKLSIKNKAASSKSLSEVVVYCYYDYTESLDLIISLLKESGFTGAFWEDMGLNEAKISLA